MGSSQVNAKAIAIDKFWGKILVLSLSCKINPQVRITLVPLPKKMYAQYI